MKNGWKTTEFWITVLTAILVTWAFNSDSISKEEWITLLTIIVPGYALSRGLSKIGGNK